MRFVLGIDMNNAAFEDNPRELVDCIGKVINRLNFEGLEPNESIILDSNGNTVGNWKITTV